MSHKFNINISYKKKQWRPPSKKKKERKKKPKPEEQESMPQHQHCPPEKRRGDKNPECHEEQQKFILAMLKIKIQHPCREVLNYTHLQ
jgi:hypothetical protein